MLTFSAARSSCWTLLAQACWESCYQTAGVQKAKRGRCLMMTVREVKVAVAFSPSDVGSSDTLSLSLPEKTRSKDRVGHRILTMGGSLCVASLQVYQECLRFPTSVADQSDCRMSPSALLPEVTKLPKETHTKTHILSTLANRPHLRACLAAVLRGSIT